MEQTEDGGQMAEDRGQTLEDGGQRTEERCVISDLSQQKSAVTLGDLICTAVVVSADL